MLIYGTQTEKNYASRKLDEWFLREAKIVYAERKRETTTE